MSDFYIIAPEDPSLDFLSSIYAFDCLGQYISGELIRVKATDEGYQSVRRKVVGMPKGALILFLGHGTKKSLLGGAYQRLQRKSIWDLGSMNEFRDKYLFLLACDSGALIKSSQAARNHYDALGFELLPTDLNEASANRVLRSIDLGLDDIELFKSDLVEIVSYAFRLFFQSENDNLLNLFKLLRVLVDRKIIARSKSGENRKVASIFVLMRSGIVIH